MTCPVTTVTTDAREDASLRTLQWRGPGWVSQLLLIGLAGPLNPGLLLAGFVPPALATHSWELRGAWSLDAMTGLYLAVAGPSALMACLAVLRMGRRMRITLYAVLADWLASWFWAALLAPICLGLMVLVAGIVKAPLQSFELVPMVLSGVFAAYVIGWCTLIIPGLALAVGVPAMVCGMIAARLCLRRAEHRPPLHVPTP